MADSLPVCCWDSNRFLWCWPCDQMSASRDEWNGGRAAGLAGTLAEIPGNDDTPALHRYICNTCRFDKWQLLLLYSMCPSHLVKCQLNQCSRALSVAQMLLLSVYNIYTVYLHSHRTTQYWQNGPSSVLQGSYSNVTSFPYFSRTKLCLFLNFSRHRIGSHDLIALYNISLIIIIIGIILLFQHLCEQKH